MLVKSVDGIEQFLSDVSGFGSSSHSLDLEGISGVVIGSAIVNGSAGVNILSSLSQLGELLKSLLVEEVGIGGQLLGGVKGVDFGQTDFSSLDDSEDIGLQPGNDGEGLIVLYGK